MRQSPTQADYAEAVQNTFITFADSRLKASHPALTQMQMPQAYSGGFAIAFRLQEGSQDWAVRCFTHDTPGIAERYAAISRFLTLRAPKQFVSVEYLSQGVRVRSDWWPITVMPWVTGTSLNDWVEANLHNPAALVRMRQQLLDLSRELEDGGYSHGDIQHGNIVVRGDGSFALVDYDGMFVPALTGQPMPELGHINYQHPQRAKAIFGPGLDRFSLATIWSALQALEVAPDLWPKFTNGENILFRGPDFAQAEGAAVFEVLKRDPSLEPIADRLIRLSWAPVAAIPPLEDVIRGNLPAVARPQLAQQVGSPFSQYQVVDLRRGDVTTYEGDRVTVVGEVVDTYKGKTRRGDPYAFVTIGAAGQTRVKVVAWSQVLPPLGWMSRLPRAGGLVAVTGLLTRYQGNLQIELERAALYEAITDVRAKALLGSAWSASPPEHPRLTHPRIGDVVRHAIWGKGEVIRFRSDIVTIRFYSGAKDIQFTTYELKLLARQPHRQATPGAATPPHPRRAPTPATATPGPASQPRPPAGPSAVASGSTIGASEAASLNALYGGGPPATSTSTTASATNTKPTPAGSRGPRRAPNRRSDWSSAEAMLVAVIVLGTLLAGVLLFGVRLPFASGS